MDDGEWGKDAATYGGCCGNAKDGNLESIEWKANPIRFCLCSAFAAAALMMRQRKEVLSTVQYTLKPIIQLRFAAAAAAHLMIKSAQ